MSYEPDGRHTMARYWRKKLSRRSIHAILRTLVQWSPLRNPEPGYSVIIGCNRHLTPLISANLRVLAEQNCPNLRVVYVVIDTTRDRIPTDVEASLTQLAASLPVHVLFYTPWQRRVAHTIDWGWVYAWLNWSLGIAATRTRYAMLHDFDALLLDRDILERRYDAIRDQEVEYLGMGYYRGLGVVPDDRLVMTFEMMFDAQFVRQHFVPTDLFNRMAVRDDRRVEYDTFLSAQATKGSTGLEPIHETQMVHPSQMICNFTDFHSGRRRLPPNNNLMMIPYYLLLGGDALLFRDLTERMDRAQDGTITIWGRPFDLSAQSPEHTAWLRKQAGRMEKHLFGGVRDEVRSYFDAMARHTGETVHGGADE